MRPNHHNTGTGAQHNKGPLRGGAPVIPWVLLYFISYNLNHYESWADTLLVLRLKVLFLSHTWIVILI